MDKLLTFIYVNFGGLYFFIFLNFIFENLTLILIIQASNVVLGFVFLLSMIDRDYKTIKYGILGVLFLLSTFYIVYL